MDTPEIVRAVEAERLALADLLDELGPAEWATDSLCAGWTVQDVVAHLTLATRLTPLGAIGAVLKARGNLNKMIGDAARERSAAATPAVLVAELRETAASAKRPLGTQPMDPLLDMLVHGQDIARPLGRSHPMPLDRVAPALEHAARSSFHGAKKRYAGIRFVATDLDFTTGDGAEVSGPAGSLLLMLTGRPAGLDGLDGPGLRAATAAVTR